MWDTPITHPDAQPFYFPGKEPACLLLHGLTSTPWEVRPVGLALKAAGIHAESLWLPGHGTSVEELATVTWREWVAAVTARYDAMAVRHEHVAVMGTSLGASLALWMATVRPVATVVSMGGAVWLNSAVRWARMASYLRPFQKKRARGSSIFDPEARRIHPSYTSMSLRAIAEMNALTGLLKQRLHKITAPCLILHARQDSVVDPGNATYVYEHVSSPTKKLVWYENSDHIITEDYEREAVTREVVDWVTTLDLPAVEGERGGEG
jgi:carboxylesterase